MLLANSPVAPFIQLTAPALGLFGPLLQFGERTRTCPVLNSDTPPYPTKSPAVVPTRLLELPIKPPLTPAFGVLMPSWPEPPLSHVTAPALAALPPLFHSGLTTTTLPLPSCTILPPAISPGVDPSKLLESATAAPVEPSESLPLLPSSQVTAPRLPFHATLFARKLPLSRDSTSPPTPSDAAPPSRLLSPPSTAPAKPVESTPASPFIQVRAPLPELTSGLFTTKLLPPC